MKILQIVDASVLFYTFHHSSKTVDFSNNTELHKSMVDFIDVGGLYPFVNIGATINSVWLIDSKPYWKNLYEPEYKAHRRRPLIAEQKDLFLDAIRDKADYLEFENFEADDIAGAITRLDLSQYDRVFYLTSDSDWMGLLDKEGTRYCINPCSSTIKVKNSWFAFQWYRSKYGEESKIRQKQINYKIKRWGEFTPSEIFLYKAAFGDSSDNLPIGSCSGLIDLLNPIGDYDLLNRPAATAELTAVINHGTTRNISGMSTFLNYFRTWGDTPIQSCTVDNFSYATNMLATAQGAMI
jgi:5'-3' exonuclease